MHRDQGQGDRGRSMAPTGLVTAMITQTNTVVRTISIKIPVESSGEWVTVPATSAWLVATITTNEATLAPAN